MDDGISTSQEEDAASSSSKDLWVAGVVINLLGSLCINLSTNCIKLAHTRFNTIKEKSEEPMPRLLKSPGAWFKVKPNRLWLASMVVFVVANVANFASFAFAAQSLLAALGSVQFVSNVVFSKLVNKERLNRYIVVGTLVVVTGCVLLVAFGSHESPSFTADELLDLYSNPAYIVYLSVAGAVCVMAYVLYKFGKTRVPSHADRTPEEMGKWYRWLPIAYMLYAATIGTQSVLYGKSMSLLLRTTISGDSQAGHWYTWLVVVLFLGTAFFWVSRFNKGLKMFPVSIIMPTLQVGWIILSMACGSIYFEEIKNMNVLEKVMFAVGTVILLCGVYLITTASTPSKVIPVETKVSVLGGVYSVPYMDKAERRLTRRHTIHMHASTLHMQEDTHDDMEPPQQKQASGRCLRRHTLPPEF